MTLILAVRVKEIDDRFSGTWKLYSDQSTSWTLKSETVEVAVMLLVSTDWMLSTTCSSRLTGTTDVVPWICTMGFKIAYKICPQS
jgi:hypothetical protein